MKFICDAPQGRTWFRLETEAEAAQESALMNHAVEKYFLREMADARASYRPTSTVSFEQNIGLKAHLERHTPLFLTLRDRNGDGLATAMLPPGGKDDRTFRIIIVGPANRDPYPEHGDAIAALGAHFGLMLDRARCYPYAGA
ncbi:MAG TPA: hypothetical protein VMV26_17690 [Alphaproteobacteria bacterium]|jgi:hypothetical protein|nr:hypothetical protein [Alphaproteobacteria bacterium]